MPYIEILGKPMDTLGWKQYTNFNIFGPKYGHLEMK